MLLNISYKMINFNLLSKRLAKEIPERVQVIGNSSFSERLNLYYFYFYIWKTVKDDNPMLICIDFEVREEDKKLKFSVITVDSYQKFIDNYICGLYSEDLVVDSVKELYTKINNNLDK